MRGNNDMKISELMMNIGANAKSASQNLRYLTSNKKNEALGSISAMILDHRAKIIEENKKDMQFGLDKNLSESMMDRLYIDETRLDGIIRSVDSVINLPDPVGSVIEIFPRPNGLLIQNCLLYTSPSPRDS